MGKREDVNPFKFAHADSCLISENETIGELGRLLHIVCKWNNSGYNLRNLDPTNDWNLNSLSCIPDSKA